jgi:hypothetical protein
MGVEVGSRVIMKLNFLVFKRHFLVTIGIFAVGFHGVVFIAGEDLFCLIGVNEGVFFVLAVGV